jgi:hypothetical protein
MPSLIGRNVHCAYGWHQQRNVAAKKFGVGAELHQRSGDLRVVPAAFQDRIAMGLGPKAFPDRGIATRLRHDV